MKRKRIWVRENAIFHVYTIIINLFGKRFPFQSVHTFAYILKINNKKKYEKERKLRTENGGKAIVGWKVLIFNIRAGLFMRAFTLSATFPLGDFLFVFFFGTIFVFVDLKTNQPNGGEASFGETEKNPDSFRFRVIFIPITSLADKYLFAGRSSWKIWHQIMRE